MNRIISIQNPKTIEIIGNDKYYFNYDIKEYDKYINEEGEEVVRYSYIQIKLIGVPQYRDVVRRIIREYISDNEEFELINDYNKYKLGILTDKNVEQKYLNYLNLVEEIKTNVKLYFNK